MSESVEMVKSVGDPSRVRIGNTKEPARLAQAVIRRNALFSSVSGLSIGLVAHALWELRHLVAYTPGRDGGVLQSMLSTVPSSLTFAAVGAALGWAFIALRGSARERERSGIAAIERLLPQSRNLLFTAWEFDSSINADDAGVTRAASGVSENAADALPSALADLVRSRAQRMAGTVSLGTLMPMKPVLRKAGIAIAVWLACIAVVAVAPSGGVATAAKRATAVLSGQVRIHHVDVNIIPPAYSGRTEIRVRDPARIEALEGSTVVFTVSATAASLHITSDSGQIRQLPDDGSGMFTVRARVERDGFIVLSPAVDAGIESSIDSSVTADVHDPHLITIAAIPDLRPGVRVTMPGHDMIVDGTVARLPVRVEADDDIGLRSLVLHYTKVSGAGEQFTFVEGEVPLRIVRSSSTSWHGEGVLKLDSLLNEPGDLVVYRARAADGKPGSQPAESDAFIAERSAEGGIAATGFALDPDEDRYRASQQMVILKTERLIAAKPTLTAQEVAERAQDIAVEQRRVRAEFVFMTGGEFEQEVVADEEGIAELDETHEAESESELAEGRMVNRGRRALLSAIRSMSRASLALVESNLTTALRHEKLALDSLQEAFSRQRFLMRALSQRETLDPSRRLSGTLDSIARGVHPALVAEPAAMREGLRRVLAELLTAGGPARTAPHSDPATSARVKPSSLSVLSVRVIQLDPSNPRAQRIAGWLQSAGAGGRSTVSPSSRAALDSATRALSEWLATLTRVDATTPAPPLQ